MRLLCFADLHIYDASYHSSIYKTLSFIIAEEEFDVIVIAGDVFENPNINPYKYLSSLTDKPVVFCFGNHEYYLRHGVKNTLKVHRRLRADGNVHCLDIDGHVKIDDVLFFGNVLWYDGSMRNVAGQGDGIVSSWLDSMIVDFDWRSENLRCERQIAKSYTIDASKKVLITHCVPHVSLNLHSLTTGLYNMYSGVKDLFTKLDIYPDVAICGHTHRAVEKVIHGVRCYNVGNDYISRGRKLRYITIDL